MQQIINILLLLLFYVIYYIISSYLLIYITNIKHCDHCGSNFSKKYSHILIILLIIALFIPVIYYIIYGITYFINKKASYIIGVIYRTFISLLSLIIIVMVIIIIYDVDINNCDCDILNEHKKMHNIMKYVIHLIYTYYIILLIVYIKTTNSYLDV